MAWSGQFGKKRKVWPKINRWPSLVLTLTGERRSDFFSGFRKFFCPTWNGKLEARGGGLKLGAHRRRRRGGGPGGVVGGRLLRALGDRGGGRHLYQAVGASLRRVQKGEGWLGRCLLRDTSAVILNFSIMKIDICLHFCISELTWFGVGYFNGSGPEMVYFYSEIGAWKIFFN